MEIKSIGHIIDESKNNCPKLYHRLKSIKNGRVLDLGFKIPILFFPLYHIFEFKKFEGVDTISQSDFYEEIKKTTSSLIKKQNVFFECYTEFVSPEKDELPKIDNIINFNQLFFNNLHFDTEIVEYLKRTENNHELYDFINLSNIIHLIDEKELSYVLNQCINRLSNDGVMYIWLKTDIDTNTWLADDLKNIFPTLTINYEYNEYKCITSLQMWYYK